MTNPFDNDHGVFLILMNDEGQYSLWPAAIDLPAGWNRQFGPDSREACLAFVERNWSDMRPASLVAAMGNA